MIHEDEDEEETIVRKFRVLDYACGTGLVSKVPTPVDSSLLGKRNERECSQALAPYASEIRGIDISTNMVTAYNEQARNQGLSPSEMSATVGDLLDPSGPSAHISAPEYYDFDLAAVGLGMHHFHDPRVAAERLVKRIKVGSGVLLVLDFLLHDHVPGGSSQNTVAHHGFEQQDVVELMKQAGCDDVDLVVLGQGAVWTADGERHPRRVFMCRGRRVQ